MQRSRAYSCADCVDNVAAAALHTLASIGDDDLHVWILIKDLLDSACIPAWLALGRRILSGYVRISVVIGDRALAKRGGLIFAARGCSGSLVRVDCRLLDCILESLGRSAHGVNHDPGQEGVAVAAHNRGWSEMSDSQRTTFASRDGRSSSRKGCYPLRRSTLCIETKTSMVRIKWWWLAAVRGWMMLVAVARGVGSSAEKWRGTGKRCRGSRVHTGAQVRGIRRTMSPFSGTKTAGNSFQVMIPKEGT